MAPTQHFIKFNMVNKIESVHWTVKKPLALSLRDFFTTCPTFYALFCDGENSVNANTSQHKKYILRLESVSDGSSFFRDKLIRNPLVKVPQCECLNFNSNPIEFRTVKSFDCEGTWNIYFPIENRPILKSEWHRFSGSKCQQDTQSKRKWEKELWKQSNDDSKALAVAYASGFMLVIEELERNKCGSHPGGIIKS